MSTSRSDPTLATRRRLVIAAAAATASTATGLWPIGTAKAQDTAWPNKPLRMLVGYPAGSGIDSAARQLAQVVASYAGQTVVVDNRPGALGNIAAQAVAQAVGDPYTVLFTPNSTHAANVHLFKKLPFDPVRDFTPIAGVATLGFVLMVDAQALKVDTVQQLVAEIRKNPRNFTYGSGNATGLVAGALFKSMIGVDLLGVPYKGVPQAITDLIGGNLQMVFADATLAVPMAKAGRVKLLAVTGSTRTSVIPDVPTLAESGLPGYDLTGWFGVFMPARVPPEAARKLGGWIQRALAEPALAGYLRSIGAEPAPSTAEELARRVTTDTERWGGLVKLAGIEPE